MISRLWTLALLLSALGACGTSVPGPDEVTTTVTEGDEEAWSDPNDPAAEGDEPSDEAEATADDDE